MQVQYPERPLLGFTENEQQIIEETIFKYLINSG
ncbi:phage virion morphogenesis protein [Pseudoalteromonas aurantia]